MFGTKSVCTPREGQAGEMQRARPVGAAGLLLGIGVASGANRVVTNSPEAGSYGGICTCPNGQVYWVADRYNWCASLACEPGECRNNCVLVLNPDRYTGRLVECEPLPPQPPSPPSSECDGTVAYAFLTRDELPLWPVWSAYFDGCPAGSALPIVHSQDVSSAARAAMASRLEPYGGFTLPPEDTLQGDLRFTFDMVRAELRLYGAAGRTLAPNGCTPQWVVTLSERDAPVRSCAAIHSELASKAGVSQLEATEDTQYIESPETLPAEFTPMVQTSQWVTLWVPHAAVLAAAEEEIAARWTPTLVFFENNWRLAVGTEMLWGAFDEWVWVTELSRHGFPYDLHGLTFVLWCDGPAELEFPGFQCEHVDNQDGNSPAAFITREAVTGACRAARSRGYSFGRKFGDGSPSSSQAVFDALLSEECIRSPDPLAPPALQSPPQSPPPARPALSPLLSPPMPPSATATLPPPSRATPAPDSPNASQPTLGAPPGAPPPWAPDVAFQLYASVLWFTGATTFSTTTVFLVLTNALLGLLSIVVSCRVLRQRGEARRRLSEVPFQPVKPTPPTPSSSSTNHQRSDDEEPLAVTPGAKLGSEQNAAASIPSRLFGYNMADVIKWSSLPLLVVQNSSLFLVMRASRTMHEDQYHPTVTVFVTELVKFVIALGMVIVLNRRDGVRAAFRRLKGQAGMLFTLAVPALCFTGQNNLLFVGVSYLSAAGAQVLVQSKTLWAAIFSALLLKKRFSFLHWTSFFVLVVGVVLVQIQDAQELFTKSANGAAGTLLGVFASLFAATLSGFAGVFLEKTFNRKTATLWELNVHLAVLALPLQALAIFEFDRVAIAERGFFYGYHFDTWLVIFIQAFGGLLTAVVIKYAGNMLKSFATSLSLISTSLLSMPMLGYEPTALFWIGIVVVCVATMMYASPTPKWCLPPYLPARTAPMDAESSAAGEEERGRTIGSRRMRFQLPGSRATRFRRMSDEEPANVADSTEREPGEPHGNGPIASRIKEALRPVSRAVDAAGSSADAPDSVSIELAGGMLMTSPWLELD